MIQHHNLSRELEDRIEVVLNNDDSDTRFELLNKVCEYGDFLR